MQSSSTGLNILVIAPQPFFQNRGTPIAIRDLLEALSQTNHKITLLCLMEGEDIQLPKCVSLVRARYPGFLLNLRPGFSLKKALVGLYLLKEASELVQESNFDLVVGVEEAAIFCSIFLGDKVNLVVDMDSDIVDQMATSNKIWAALRPLLSYIYSIPFRKSLCAIAVSKSLAYKAVKYGAKQAYILEDCADIIPDEIVESVDKAITSTQGDGEKIILYIGNLERYQGIHLLLEAFAKLILAYKIRALLVIVGGTLPHISKYRKKALDLGVLDKCMFTGPKRAPELWRYLASADCLVSPRLCGVNTPMKVYTYMASKKPIVATKIESHTQVLSDHESYLSEVNPEDLAEKMYLALTAKDAKLKAQNAFQKFIENYSREKFKIKVNAIFQDIESILLARKCRV
ncbi:MAG: glycosyltransferase family 4 protein [Thermoplasmatales archaeon]